MDVVKMFINGEWIGADSGKTRNIFNPATGEHVATVAEGGAEETKRACEAAAAAAEGWKNTSNAVRAALLQKAADIFASRKEEIALQECRHTGRLLRTCVGDVLSVAKIFKYYAGIIGTPAGQSYNDSTTVTTLNIYEPIGVCGMIIPWNSPISIASKCIAPALAAGNTIVVKPSSVTPLGAVEMFKAMDEAGFPKGVVNLVLGEGSVVGTELGENKLVGKVSLTGGTDTGKSLIRASANNVKKLSLELGGKSACMVFDDGDIDAAIDNIMYAAFATAGQLCVAATRILVQEGIYDEFCRKLVERTQKVRVGLTEDPSTEMGPVISKTQLERYLRYIEIGKKEGATLACGGYRITEAPFDKGNYVAPTVFIDVKNDMRIAQEEIFGPVLAVEKFSTEEEAFKIANDSIYGLGAAVFTNDVGRSLRFTKKVKAACLWVNTYMGSTGLDASVCCTKQSGYSVLMGIKCLESYMDIKQCSIFHTTRKYGWFKC